jgi:peptide/nickel transport system ATP-binding protein
MYAAEVVEQAPAELIGTAPAHPYTLGLLRSFPDMRSARRELRGVPGNPPDLRADFPGCPFQPRCEYHFEPCPGVHPLLGRPAGREPLGPATHGWQVACHLHNPAYRPDGPPPALSGRPAAADSPAGADSPVGADSSGGDS